MKIAGIDPGTARIGYAIIEGDRRVFDLVHAETITVPSRQTAAERLTLLERALAERFRRDKPDGVAIEKIFFSKNARTAIAVAEARGIILLTARSAVTSIWEYTPLEVKLAVSGYGRAEKPEVRRMVRSMLPKAVLPSGDDAIDAIAIALTALYRESQHVHA